MKTMKRILAGMVAVILMAAMLVVPASANSDYSITISDSIETNQYAAYQIFAGDLKITDEGSAILSNIKWADETEGEAILTALKNTTFSAASTPFKDVKDAKGVADVLTAWEYNGDDIKHFADVVAGVVTGEGTTPDGESTYSNGSHIISKLAAGYYLILTTNVETGAFGYTDYLLKVTSDVKIAPKVSLPTLTKTVGDTLDGTYANGADFQVDASESDNGFNVIYFKLDGTLPSEYEAYKQYHYKMTDVIDTSIFSVNPEDFVQEIYVQRENGTKSDMSKEKYARWDVDTKTLTVDFGNLKEQGEELTSTDHIVVIFKVSLIGTPIVGKGNSNPFGNVNTAKLYYSNDPNQESGTDEDDIHWGSTSDTASVYTYGIELTKVDATTPSTTLAGAEFTLSREITDSGMTTTYYAVVKEVGGVYRVERWVTDAAASNLTMTTGNDGTITVTGLDSEQYQLTETKAPGGYNQLTEPVSVHIQATIDTAGALTKLEGTADYKAAAGDTTTGILSFNIANNGGATLPETGGMGTTLFYVVGGALMVGAAAILFTKKRNTQK